MGVKRVEELFAWQLAVEFKSEVYRLLRGSRAASRDVKYRHQISDAMSSTESNIVEGFHRNSRRQFAVFLTYARASHAEAETRLKDGIKRDYFSPADAGPALRLAKRCCMAILRLRQSQDGE